MNSNTKFLNTTIEFLSTKPFEELLIQTRLQLSKLKKKSFKEMDEARAGNKIEAKLPQEKIDFINHAHARDVEY